MDILAVPFILLTVFLFIKRNQSRNYKIAFQVFAAITLAVLIVLAVLTAMLMQEGFPG